MRTVVVLIALLFLFTGPAKADIALSQLPIATTVSGTDGVPLVQNGPVDRQGAVDLIGGTIFADATAICSLSPTTCGALFGFVLPQWYGGYCDSNWNSNNNFHDDSAAIAAAMQSGYPVYIYHCKIASTVQYSGNDQILMSFSNIVPYDLSVSNQPFPGAIFVPSNLSTTGENCAIDFNGYNSLGLYGINIKGNSYFNGSAGICGAHISRGPSMNNGLTFTDVEYFAAQELGMGFGGATDGNGVPQVGSGSFSAGCGTFPTSISYGCDIQISMRHIQFAQDFIAIRGNITDGRIDDYGIATMKAGIAISSFNQYTGGEVFSNGRIEDNFGTIPTGTSGIYLTPQSGVTTGANGLIIAGQYAQWQFTNTQFTANSETLIDAEGGNLEFSSGSISDTGNGNAAIPFDCNAYISPTLSGNILMEGFVLTTQSGHPAYGLCGGTTTSQISILNSYPQFGATANFNFSATPAALDFSVLGQNRQYIGGNTGMNIGTAQPLSTLDIGGNLAVGTQYAGITTSPANSLIVGGKIGVGTSNPLNGTILDARGLATFNGDISNGTPFTVASGCGTTGAVVGGATRGSFTAGATSCAPVISLPTAPHGWICGAKDLTTPSDAFTQIASSATSCTVSATVTSADTILIDAHGY